MMKHSFFLFIIFVHSSLFGFDVGFGFGWSAIDEGFKSDLFTNENKSGKDKYEVHLNRLVPVVSLGHQFYFYDDWIVRVSGEWKYLNYRTPNMNSSRGQILPNASFSSKNIFGGDTERDFTSTTHVHNEILLLASVGKMICDGCVYVGLGPVLFNASNSIYVTAVHTPNGVGDHLLSTSVRNHKLIWGGAAQVGYQYFLNSNFFVNVGYKYLQTGSYSFKNSVNTAILNGFIAPGPTVLSLRRTIEFTIQELVFSMNLMF